MLYGDKPVRECIFNRSVDDRQYDETAKIYRKNALDVLGDGCGGSALGIVLDFVSCFGNSEKNKIKEVKAVNVDFNNLILTSEAKRDFSRIFRHIDDNGIAVIIENDCPVYVIMDYKLFLNNYGVVDEDSDEDEYAHFQREKLCVSFTAAQANELFSAAKTGSVIIEKDEEPCYIMILYDDGFFSGFDMDVPKDKYEKFKNRIKGIDSESSGDYANTSDYADTGEYPF